ncbi:hypothetical protein ABT084_03570 [Streptomyces sp. NPDC002138]|uniref:hypothetical protein n=1 Tax=Streptomyces sp. NPDC002138 TaxID=3154410 RepID=UPI00331B7084
MSDQVNRFGGTHDQDPGDRAHAHDHERDLAPDRDRDRDRAHDLGPQELRGLLLGAVGGLTPSDGALERLRHAVPARKARKRQAVIGAAAAVLLCGTAVPVAMRLTAAEGTAGDHSAMAGHSATAEGKHKGASDPHAAGAGQAPRSAQDPAPGQGAAGADRTPPPGAPTQAVGGSGSGQATAGAPAGGGPLPSAAPGLPGCGEAQLGVRAGARTAAADGKVYGSFRVTNLSTSGCAVTGSDTLTAAPAAGAAAGQAPVAVLAHTASDPATGLPEPVAQAPSLVLQPAMAYEVRFAFVPDASCPAGTPAPGPKPPQVGGALAPGTTATDSATAAEPTRGPVPEGAGVALTHAPQGGAPVTTTTIPTACGGTVYRTGVIPLDATSTSPSKPQP